MKFPIIITVLLGFVLPVLASADKVAVKPIRIEVELDEEDDYDEEWDLEKEVFGPQVQRYEGINILDEDFEIVLSDPSERVLKALAEPSEKKNALTLDKVKAMYREHIEKQQREHNLKAGYSQKDFEEMFAKEQKIAQKEAEADDTVIQRVMNLFW